MGKRFILLGLMFFCLVFTVYAVSLNAIPNQEHVQDVTTDKTIDLSQFSSIDTNDYAFQCNANQMIGGLIGVGRNQNFTFHPAAGFLGTATCTITAKNSTDEANKSVSFNVIAQNLNLQLTVPGAEFIKTKTLTTQLDISVLNNGNVDLNTVTATISDLVQVGDATNTITQDSIQVANSIPKNGKVNVTVKYSNLNNKKSANYTGTLTVSGKSAFGNKNITKTAKVDLEVRQPRFSLQFPNNVTLGESNQKRNQNVTGSFTIKNNGESNLTNLIVSTSAKNFDVKLSQNSNFVTNLTIPLLNVGDSSTINLQGFVGGNISAGIVDIGDILVNSATFNTSFGNFIVTPESLLKISKVAVEYTDIDNDLQVQTVDSNNELVDDVLPGTRIEFEVTVENLFEANTDITIDDVEVKVIINNIDNGADVDDESGQFDIDADEDEKETIILRIPPDAERDEFSVVVTAKGKEKKSKALHKAELKFKIQVDRREHDITLSDVKLDSAKLGCSRKTILDVFVENQGRNDEKETILTATSPALGLNFRSAKFELTNDYEDDDSKQRFRIPVDASNVDPGEYRIRTTVFFSEDIPDDIKDLILEVTECGVTATKTELKENTEAETLKSKADNNIDLGDTRTVEVNQNAILLDDDSGLSPLYIAFVMGIIVLVTMMLVSIVILGKKQ